MPFENALWRQLGEDTHCLESNMAAGVHQDRGLTKPLQGMENPTDAEMAREDHGLMTYTGCQVS